MNETIQNKVKNNFENICAEVRKRTRCTLRLTAEGRSVVLELPCLRQEREEALTALEMPDGCEVTATLLSGGSVPEFLVELCCQKPMSMTEVSLFHELILECHDLDEFDRNRWERQARMMGIDNFVDMATLFEESMMLYDFPDIHSQKQVEIYLARMTGMKESVIRLGECTFLDTAEGILMYTAGDQGMIDLMERYQGKN